MAKQRPGVMFYFNALPLLNALSDADIGRVFRAAMLYGLEGTEPEFAEPVLMLAWGFLKSSVDRDGERYEKACINRAYGPYLREASKKGVSPISRDEWNTLSDIERGEIQKALKSSI